MIFFSGIQFLEIDVMPSALPPMNINADAVLSADPGCEERASVVASTGPMTPAKFIIAESTAYATLKKSAGTTSFHRGLTERLIGGAVTPRTNAAMRRRFRSCAMFNASNIAA